MNEPTIRDVLDAIRGLETRIGGLETKIDAVRREMRAMEGRLKAEISGAYDIHEERIGNLEERVKKLERSTYRPH